MEATSHSLDSINRFEYKGIQFEQSDKRLHAYLNNIPLGEVHLAGLFSYGKSWKKITPTEENDLNKAVFYVSVKDLELVESRAESLNLVEPQAKQFHQLMHDNVTDITDKISAKDVTENIFKEIGINIALIRDVSSKLLEGRRATPQDAWQKDAWQTFALLKQILKIKQLVSNDRKNTNEDSASVNLLLERLSWLAAQAQANLAGIPKISDIIPTGFLPVYPMQLKHASQACEAGYAVEEYTEADVETAKSEVRDVSKYGRDKEGRQQLKDLKLISADESIYKLRLLQEKLKYEDFVSNQEFRGIPIEISKMANGCVDFTIVDSEISFAFLSDGTGHFAPENKPFLEKIWTDFMKNIRKEMQEMTFSDLDDAKGFLYTQIQALNKVFETKQEAGAATLALTWILKTKTDEKHALMINVGDSAIVLIKGHREDENPTFTLIQPQSHSEFSTGAYIQPTIIDIKVDTGDTICLLSDGISGGFTSAKDLVAFLDPANDKEDLEAIAERKLKIVKSLERVISDTGEGEGKKEFVEKGSLLSKGGFQGLYKEGTTFGFDDLSLIYLSIK